MQRRDINRLLRRPRICAEPLAQPFDLGEKQNKGEWYGRGGGLAMPATIAIGWRLTSLEFDSDPGSSSPP
jgi:hypothetical protein